MLLIFDTLVSPLIDEKLGYVHLIVDYGILLNAGH